MSLRAILCNALAISHYPIPAYPVQEELYTLAPDAEEYVRSTVEGKYPGVYIEQEAAQA